VYMKIRCKREEVVEKLLERKVQIEDCTFLGYDRPRRLSYLAGRTAWGKSFPILIYYTTI